MEPSFSASTHMAAPLDSYTQVTVKSVDAGVWAAMASAQIRKTPADCAITMCSLSIATEPASSTIGDEEGSVNHAETLFWAW